MLYRDWWPRFKTSLPPSGYHELDAFLGLPAIFLALVGISRPNRETRGKYVMIILAIIALCCMHFKYVPELLSRPVAMLLAKMSIRYPYRFFMVLLLPMAFFVSCGIDSFRGFCESGRKGLFLTLFLLAAAAYCVVGLVIWSKYTMFRLQPSFAAVIVITFLFSCFIFLSALFDGGSNFFYKKIFPAVTALTLFFLYYFSYTNTIVPSDYSLRNEKPDILNRYPSIKEVISVLFERPKKTYSNVPLKTPYRIYNPGVSRMNSWATRTRSYIAFEDPIDDPSTGVFINRYYHCIADYESPLFDLYNVRFIRIITGYNGKKLLPTPLFQVYFNPDAFERFFIVHKVREFGSDGELWTALRSAPHEELKDNLFLPYPLEGMRDDKGISDRSAELLRLVKMRPRLIELDVRLDNPGFIVATEMWFPAWEVRVDGVKQKLLRAYGAFWAVSVGKGAHSIEFRFIDRYTLAGKIISALALLAAVIFLKIPGKKLRSPPRLP